MPTKRSTLDHLEASGDACFDASTRGPECQLATTCQPLGTSHESSREECSAGSVERREHEGGADVLQDCGAPQSAPHIVMQGRKGKVNATRRQLAGEAVQHVHAGDVHHVHGASIHHEPFESRMASD